MSSTSNSRSIEQPFTITSTSDLRISIAGGAILSDSDNGFAVSHVQFTPTVALPQSSMETGGKPPRWFAFIERQLNAIANSTSEELDGYPCPPAESIEAARKFAFTYLEGNTPTPSVVPSSEGGIEFIWYKGGWHLEVAVGHGEINVWAHNIKSGALWNGSLDATSEKLRDLLGGLSSLP